MQRMSAGGCLTIARIDHNANSNTRIVLFCNKYSLALSVKAGGYGTGGWAIGGDIIVDLSKLVEVDIETPQEDGSFTSLKDIAPANSKGKKAVSGDASSKGKRRREEDAELRHYDSASRAVADFLRGPDPSLDVVLPPNNRRRIDPPPSAAASSSVSSRDRTPFLSADSSSNTSSNAWSPSAITASASPSPGPLSEIEASTQELTKSSMDVALTQSNADPFGYLDTPTNFPPIIPARTVQSFYNLHAMLNIWGIANPNALLADDPSALTQMNMLSHVEPPYSHVYVTFGAGMRQKEIDTYTAKNPIEAKYPSGFGFCTIPYHVPL